MCDCMSIRTTDQQCLAAPQQELDVNSTYYFAFVSQFCCHEASQRSAHLVSCRGKPTEQHCDNSMNAWVYGQFKVSTLTNQWVFGQVGGRQLRPVETHISGDHPNSTHRGRRTRAFSLRGERTNQAQSYCAALLYWKWHSDFVENTQTKLFAVSWLSSSPNPLCNASFEQKLVSKDAAETANLDAGERKNVN